MSYHRFIISSLSLGLLLLASTFASAAEVALEFAARKLQATPDELEVLGEVHLGDVKRFKVLDRKRAHSTVINIDQSGNEVPDVKVKELIAKRRAAAFVGKKEKTLAAKLESIRDADTLTVAIWVTPSGLPPRVDRSVPPLLWDEAAALSTASRFHHNATRGVLAAIEARGGRIDYQAEHAPLVIATVPRHLLPWIEKRAEVEALYPAHEYQPALNVSTRVIGANTVWSRGMRGQGVKIAVVEKGAVDFPRGGLATGSYCNPLATSPISGHATVVASVIADNDKTRFYLNGKQVFGIKGVAFDAPGILSGNAVDYSEAEIIRCTDWAINNGARVINFSIVAGPSAAMTALERYVDYITRYRAVTVVIAAGNIGSQCSEPTYRITAPASAFNAIAVGAYNDVDTGDGADDVMSSSSCFGNPTSPHSDREKPEVVAPGEPILTSCSLDSGCSATVTTTGSTSLAAPHVAGCAALLMQRDPALTTWPEAIKAILMASAIKNLEGATRLSDKDGAGGVRCDAADDVVSRVAGYESHGSLGSASFPRPYVFSATAGQRVRVVISWGSDTAGNVDVLKADLDLHVYDPAGGYVAGSSSWDNSYEIVDFVAASTGQYTAKAIAYRFEGVSEPVGFAVWREVKPAPATSVYDLLAKCPTTSEITAIHNDFDIYVDSAVYAQPDSAWRCNDGGGESNVMLTVYNALRLMKFIRFAQPMPILNSTDMYEWLRSRKIKIHLFAGAQNEASSGGYDTIHLNSYNLGASYFRYWRQPNYGVGVSSVIALLLHEARHTDPGGRVFHDCLNQSSSKFGNDSSMAMQGAWAVQYNYWKHVGTDPGIALSAADRDAANFDALDIKNTRFGCN